MEEGWGVTTGMWIRKGRGCGGAGKASERGFRLLARTGGKERRRGREKEIKCMFFLRGGRKREAADEKT